MSAVWNSTQPHTDAVYFSLPLILTGCTLSPVHEIIQIGNLQITGLTSISTMTISSRAAINVTAFSPKCRKNQIITGVVTFTKVERVELIWNQRTIFRQKPHHYLKALLLSFQRVFTANTGQCVRSSLSLIAHAV